MPLRPDKVNIFSHDESLGQVILPVWQSLTGETAFPTAKEYDISGREFGVGPLRWFVLKRQRQVKLK